MRKRLFYQQSEPGSRVAATAQRLSVKARIMMALFALMLIPQGAWAQGGITGTLTIDNISDLSGYAGAVAYDETTNTLSLKNANVMGVIENTHTSINTLTVEIEGNNSINTSSSGSCISGSGSIVFKAKTTSSVLTLHSKTGSEPVFGFTNMNKTSPQNYNAKWIDSNDPAQATVEAVYLRVGDILVSKSSFSGTSSSITLNGSCITSGTVSFNFDTTNDSGILTLNNADITYDAPTSGTDDSYGVICQSCTSLTIDLVGTNTIDCGNGQAFNKSMTITTSSTSPGTLTMKSNYSGFYSSYVYSGYVSLGGPLQQFAKQATASTPNIVSFAVPYDLLIGNVKVTSANKDDIAKALHPDSVIVATGGSISFDPSSSTLILNNVELKREITSELPNLTVRFIGNNKVNTDSQDLLSGACDHAIRTNTSSVSLTFEKGGDGSLELDGKDVYSAVAGFASVSYGDGCYLKTDVPTKYSSDDKCYINFANGNAFVDVVTISTDVYYPLWIGTSTTAATQVATTTITAGVTEGTVTFTPAIGTTSSKLSLSDATIEAKILSALGNLVIEVSGKNTISSPDSGTVIRSVNEGTLTLERAATIASLELKTNLTDNTKPVIQGFHTLSYNTSFDLNTSATTPTYGIFYSMYGLFDAGPGGIFAIMQATFAKNYGLSIAGTQVTSANAGNIRNDGTLSYVHDATNNTGTLTLNGVTLNGGDISTSMSDLTIHVKGNNKISAASNCIRSSATTPGKLTFTKDTGGKLELDNASNHYSVIKGFNELDGVPLETKAPYEIYINGDYYRLKQLFVAAGDTASIDYAWVYADTTYPIWVDGHQATSVSANNILGDAGSTASFNSNTLTLNVANIPGAIVSSLTSTLTISVKGNSTVSGGIFQTSNATADLVVSKDATATGNVSLLVNPGREAAIRGFSSFTYTDFVPFNSSGTTDLSDGISYESNALKYNGTALGAVYLLSKTDLATAGLTFTMASVAYTGAAVVLPTTATMDNGTTQTTLTQTTDYIVTGYKASDKTALTSAPIAAGNYYATIQGNGIYTGTADAAFTIDQADFTPPSVISIAAVTAQTYTGLEIKPTPTVTFGSTQLTAGTDFDYSYANNTNAALSTATPAPTVTINGKGNFKGTNSVTFTIDPKSVAGLEVNVSGTYTYTGSAIQPTSIEVKDGSKILASGTDYTIYTYSNNVDVADANDPTAPPTVTIKGMGNYDSKTTKDGHFTIAQADFTTTTLLSIAAVADQTYTGSEIKPTPAVTFNGTTLTAGTDFEYDYANNTDAASSSATPAPTVIVNGKGSFTGSKSVNFTINPKSIRGTTVAVSGSYTYSGAGIVPPAENVTVTDGTKVLQNGKDYTYGCSSNINAGTATITVTGMGNYATTTTENGTFTIDPATITDVEVGATEFEYAPGDTKTVTITKVSAGSLVLGTSDYSLSGTQSAIAVGSYQFTVTGTGNFQGFKNVDWKINERPANITFKTGHTFRTFYDASEDFLVPDGVTAYIVTGVNDNSVTVTKVSYIQAGVPVLLESTSGSTIAKDPSETFAGNLLNYADRTVVTDGNQYVLYSDEFVPSGTTCRVAGSTSLTRQDSISRMERKWLSIKNKVYAI